MPTTRAQKQAMISIPSKLRTGSGRINKPGKPTRKHYPDYDPQQNVRRQRLAPKLRVMFVRFLLDRLEAQGIAVEELPREDLREHIAAMSDNFLSLAANLERDERDVDDLADVFGKIVAPSGADVVDMMDMLESASLLGESATPMDHDREVEEPSASPEYTADGDDSSESDFADTMLAADETEWGDTDDTDEEEDDVGDEAVDEHDDEDDTDEGVTATRDLPPNEQKPEDDDYDDGIE